ncbi:hypothetical protein BSY239_684 [Hydrogenophaga sp. RAC07]|uniref:hypothetical protein n=1 Tax=Hydrogenophaga sp. RAC07 TaxID=1842537 RepID=UPI00083E37F0|nr:hypothetical protein [Hydrogenophaga sp. RAC07]AOF85687.1 hypothetical protein BSY239_684 [Hydrogenophaga sp. RAC07]
MSSKPSKSTAVAKSVVIEMTPEMTPAQATAKAALKASLNAAMVVDDFNGNILGKDMELHEIVRALSDNMSRVHGGDLTLIEGMLVGQATALQTIFTSLAKRAQRQEHLRQYESFLGLALKAQSQSRTTIQTLIDLKFPRQATFVKQANIANGPQQVNNGAQSPAGEGAPESRAQEIPNPPNKLLEAAAHEGIRVDTRTASAPGRSDSVMEAVGAIHRTEDTRGKEPRGRKCIPRRSEADASRSRGDVEISEPVAR